MDEELKNKILLAQAGDKEVLNELVKENYGLIYSISSRFKNRGYEMEDIYQIGAIGLIKAIQKFDFSYNVVLSTFAVTYIIGEIKRFLRDDGPIKVSRQLKYLAAQIKEEQSKNENITIKELQEKLQVSKEEIVMAMDSSNMLSSLDEKIDDDGMSLMERIGSNETTEEKIINNIALKQCIEKLEPRDKKIIYLRYYKCQTQKKVAEIIGISQVQVSRIEKQILKNMEKEFMEKV